MSVRGGTRWRVVIRIAGALLALACILYWAASGANTGWTKDRIAVTKTDEVTGIEYTDYTDGFLPGLEFLALGTGLGLALVAVTFFSRKKTTHTS